MSKLLYLIRHGHALHNELYTTLGVQAFRIPEVIDSPLTEIGHEQSLKLSETIMDHKIDVVLVSPLLRTLETAHNIFKSHNVPIVCEEFLREYPIGLDTCNQRSDIDRMREKFPKIDFSHIRENEDVYWSKQGETMDELETRIQKMKDYLRDMPQDNIAIVSHSSFLGQFKDQKIGYLENGDEELAHCYPYKYILDR